ncbi:MAG: aldehyde dehydrogenase family protein [Verrucomicrobiota bacterium]
MNSDTIVSYAPATKRVIGEISATHVESVPESIKRAKAAQADWKALPTQERCQRLLESAAVMETRSDDLAHLLAEESGKILPQSQFEVRITIEFLRKIAESANAYQPETIQTDFSPALKRDHIVSRRVPYGVVVAILPFNFPVELYIEKAAAALAMGNAVIVKSPPQTPLVVQMMTDCLHQGGIPKNVLQCLHGYADLGQALTSSPGVDLISLTGSTAAGIAVAANSAPHLPRLHLELGGNDPAILLEDADLDLAAAQIVYGRTLMNGQTCASNKRIIVHRSLHEGLAERLTEKLSKLAIGDPLDPASQLGPLIDPPSAQRVASQTKRILEQGGKLLHGKLEPDSAFLTPLLVGEVPKTADVASDDEIFGPVLPLIPFDEDSEAIEIANQSCYGLSGSVFSQDWERAESVAEQLEAGGVVLNGTGNYRPYIVPFGGVKMSGVGREGLGYTLEEMSQTRYTVWRNWRKD